MLNRTLLMLGLSGAAILIYAAFQFFAPIPISVSMPLYPGAREFEGYRYKHDDGYDFFFTSSDSAEDVLAYYDARLPEDIYYKGAPQLTFDIPDAPYCFNLTYKGTDCMTWMHTKSVNKKSFWLLDTSQGIYSFQIYTVPSPAKANENYYFVQVQKGGFGRISCGLCP